MAKSVKEWLLEIADALEGWPTMRPDDMDGWLHGATPAGAVRVILQKAIIPAEQIEAIRRALPELTTDDFALEARRIREAAEKLAGLRPVFDEQKLDRIRAFLRERFRGMEMTDQFDFDKTAQRFTLGPGTNRVHSLVVTKEALDDLDFVFLLNDRLVDALKLAGALPVTLTSKGPRY
jgi:hypothetical protein